MTTTEKNARNIDDDLVRTWSEKLRALTEAYRKARDERQIDPSPQIVRGSSLELKSRHQCQVELVGKDPLRGSARLGIWLVGEHLAAIGGRDLMDRVYEAAGEDVSVDHIWDGIAASDHVVWVC